MPELVPLSGVIFAFIGQAAGKAFEYVFTAIHSWAPVLILGILCAVFFYI